MEQERQQLPKNQIQEDNMISNQILFDKDVVSSAGKGFSKMASAVGGWFG
ncbi:Uncharacterised protein [Streptococcus criceti]|uniref:Uncharacterized protein n=1 Tax=Streptococcus criceti HS-6 TaxID=873449 RepID=G5JNS9_STRCG|nr:hypothetical protein [Streptococcus criceti]EHI75157.1 hypothetical protein STRCR_0242 [Streptococcus criceti HS-6]SUN41740.1 Uncharacterised protein [Streptococcus criceti]